MNNRVVMLTLGYTGLLPFYGFLAAAWSLEDWPAAVSVQGLHYLLTRYSVFFSRYLMGSRAVV
jgi:hypothetical protein